MKSYPSIQGPTKAPKKYCYVFVKYDGSNMRAEWSKKRGWYKFGTRNQMIDSSDPVFGQVPAIFINKYGESLEKVFQDTKDLKSITNFVVFFEFFGSNSFAGQHKPNDNYDVVLFDVNPIKKGMLGPKQFLDYFGHLKVAELICQSNMGEELIQQVRDESIDLGSKFDIRTEIPEGVICKGGNSDRDLWMCKIKTDRYKTHLQERYESDWNKYWEG